MANILVTDNIVDPVSGAPISARTLDHINSMSELIGDAMFKSIQRSYVTNTVIILYGCDVAVTSGAIPGTGTATLDEGYIYYNGVIYAVDANASLSTTNPQTLIWVEDNQDDNATFTDGNTYPFHREAKLKLEAGTAGTGLANYNATTLLNVPVASDNSGEIKIKELAITNWDMNGTATFNVAHGISDITKIKSVDILIFNDAQTDIKPLNYWNTAGTVVSGYWEIGSTNVAMTRVVTGQFVGGDYNGSGTRGTIQITYVV